MGQYHFALEVMILGFLTVLFTLFLLFLVISLLGRLIGGPKAKNIKNITPKTTKPDTIPIETVAAITAAVYTCLEESGQGTNFRITKINKVPKSLWTDQGIKDLHHTMEDVERMRREKSGQKSF